MSIIIVALLGLITLLYTQWSFTRKLQQLLDEMEKPMLYDPNRRLSEQDSEYLNKLYYQAHHPLYKTNNNNRALTKQAKKDQGDRHG